MLRADSLREGSVDFSAAAPWPRDAQLGIMSLPSGSSKEVVYSWYTPVPPGGFLFSKHLAHLTSGHRCFEALFSCFIPVNLFCFTMSANVFSVGLSTHSYQGCLVHSCR